MEGENFFFPYLCLLWKTDFLLSKDSITRFNNPKIYFKDLQLQLALENFQYTYNCTIVSMHLSSQNKNSSKFAPFGECIPLAQNIPIVSQTSFTLEHFHGKPQSRTSPSSRSSTPLHHASKPSSCTSKFAPWSPLLVV